MVIKRGLIKRKDQPKDAKASLEEEKEGEEKEEPSADYVEVPDDKEESEVEEEEPSAPKVKPN